MSYESVNPVHGRNPWDRTRTPGGSSGGESAAIAVGASALGIGTDILGSVRVPAALTGLVGFKPTAGRATDQQRHSIPPGQSTISSQVGPLARTVADVTLALRVLLGEADVHGRPVVGCGGWWGVPVPEECLRSWPGGQPAESGAGGARGTTSGLSGA